MRLLAFHGPMITVPVSDLVWRNPPFPFVDWCEAAVKKYLRLKGFDFSKPVYRIRGMGEDKWVQ